MKLRATAEDIFSTAHVIHIDGQIATWKGFDSRSMGHVLQRNDYHIGNPQIQYEFVFDPQQEIELEDSMGKLKTLDGRSHAFTVFMVRGVEVTDIWNAGGEAEQII